VRHIELTQGQYAVVDDEDFNLLNSVKWCLVAGGKYAGRRVGSKTQYMHVFIAGLYGTNGERYAPMFVVDHINGDTLDNRKDNLRLCTQGENSKNRRAQIGTSVYKGVGYEKKAGKWRARIRDNYKHIFLGYFDTPEEAAEAYQDAARLRHGEFASIRS